MPSQNVKTGQPNLFQRVWYSIFPHTYKEQDERRPYWGWLNTLVLHFRPKVVHERTLRFTLTWGLGGLSRRSPAESRTKAEVEQAPRVWTCHPGQSQSYYWLGLR
jgi:hypothetical protein